MPPQLQSALGFALLLLLCWLSGQRRRPLARVVIGGVVLQALVALVLIKLPGAQGFFALLNNLMLALEESTRAGTSLVFGYLGGGAAPFDPSRPEHGYILAFRGLPMVLVMSALSALLFYWRILPVVVRGFSWLLNRALGVSGPLGVGATANVFLGMVEAPLLIRPYLLSLQRGELFAVMVCGMATVAGTVLVLYAALLSPVIVGALGLLLPASLVTAPASLALGSLFPPWPPCAQGVPDLPREGSRAMDAVTTGTTRGL